MDEALEERARIVDWLRKEAGAAGVQLTLAAGLPGGTATQRVKNRAFASGFCKAVKVLLDHIEAGEHDLVDLPRMKLGPVGKEEG